MAIVKALLEAGADINAVDELKRTALHLSVDANMGGADATSEVEQFMIDRGANVLAVDERGRIPLHYAFVKIGMYVSNDSTDDAIQSQSHLLLSFPPGTQTHL